VNGDDSQNGAVDTGLKIASPPDAKPVLTFASHMAMLDDFVADCNQELRKRGFHVCEANVAGNWLGQATLVVTAAINAPTIGAMPVACKLMLPWLLPEPMDVATIVTNGLQAVEGTMVELCSRNRVLRISFEEVARRQSRTLTIAPPENGRRSVLVTP